MGDEEQKVDAAQEVSPEDAIDASESAVTIDSDESLEADEKKLRLAPREESASEGAAGSSEPADSNEDDLDLSEGEPPAKKGLAALFAGSPDPDEDEGTPKWAMPGARARRQGSSIRIVNRVMVAAVILILVFGVLDLFATIRQPPGGLALLDTPALVSGEPPPADAAPSEVLPPLANLLESFIERPIVRDLDRGGGQTTVQVVQTRTRVPDWKLQAQKLDLIGLSPAPDGETEAIVSDRDSGRMHILKVGQNMVVGESQFTLVRVATDHVAFEKDGEEVIVK